MNRLFGQKKEAAPKPTMADAQASMEKRSGHLDEKIAKLDKELNKDDFHYSLTSFKWVGRNVIDSEDAMHHEYGTTSFIESFYGMNGTAL